jgi:hypothetical protein
MNKLYSVTLMDNTEYAGLCCEANFKIDVHGVPMIFLIRSYRDDAGVLDSYLLPWSQIKRVSISEPRVHYWDVWTEEKSRITGEMLTVYRLRDDIHKLGREFGDGKWVIRYGRDNLSMSADSADIMRRRYANWCGAYLPEEVDTEHLPSHLA